MTTTTLYSNKGQAFAFFVKKIRQGLPFIIISTIVSFLFLLLPFLLSIADTMPFDLQKNGLEYYTEFGIYPATGYVVFIYVLFAIIVFIAALYNNSYMHSKPRTDFYHSMPVTRTQTVVLNSLAGISTVAVPFIAIYLLTMVIQVATFHVIPSHYYAINLIEIISSVVYFSVVYMFTTLIATSVGTVFDNLAATLSIGLLPFTLAMTAGVLFNSYIYGASDLSPAVLYASPFLYPIRRMIDFYDYDFSGYWLNIKSILVGLAFLAGITILTIISYNKRKSELAESRDSMRWPMVLTKSFVSFLSTIIFFAIFFSMEDLPRSIFAIIGGVVVGIVGEIILSRGVRSLVPSLKWLTIGSALFIAMLLTMQYDLFSYSTRVPSVNNISAVSLSYNGRYSGLVGYAHYIPTSQTLDSREAIETVASAHKAIVSNIPQDSYRYSSNQNYSSASLSITYSLKTGGTLTRYYGTVYIPAYEKLIELETDEKFIKNNHPIFFCEEQSVPQAELISKVEISNILGDNLEKLPHNIDQYTQLINAIQQDMLGETLEGIAYPTSPAKAIIALEYNVNPLFEADAESMYTRDNPRIITGYVVVTQEYTKTLALLNLWGYGSVLSPNASDYNEAYFWDSASASRSGEVAIFNPLDAYSHSLNTDDLPITTSSTVIAAIIQNSVTQCFVSYDNFENDGYVEVLLLGDYRGSGLVYIQRSKLDQLLNSATDGAGVDLLV